MKKSKAYLQGSYMLLASFVLISCKKQLTEPAADAAIASSTTVQSILPPTTCKPVVFGSFGTFANTWHTLEQKWYTGSQLTSLAAEFGTTGNA
ncbi:MAG TPA: hypothetical protein VFZ47_00405, partial [Chitinophagaceae bacterium]